jgi:phosphoglycolate phosphatase-like HAD superfamily hydrolase
MRATDQTLVLLDIDGTLIRSGGAGREALDRAFVEILNVQQATAGISLAGATDGWILDKVEQRAGFFDRQRLQKHYFQELERLLSTPGRAFALPGVVQAVGEMEQRAVVGLTTGNWKTGARIKLGAVGLDRLVDRPGAFGDDSHDRTALVPYARARAEAAGIRVDRVVVIGDTPADVACARAGGAIAVAVETGFAEASELAAAQPDLQIPDLERGLSWVLALL